MSIFQMLKKKITSCPELIYTIFLFLSTRITLSFIGLLSYVQFNDIHPRRIDWTYSQIPWLNMWGIWDTGWYLDIAANWYKPLTQVYSPYVNYVFFPFYPLLIKLVGFLITNQFIAGVIISNICIIISSIYLFRLVRLENTKIVALRAIKYLFIFPTAFIFSGVFSESLFLMLVLMCFYYAKTNKWGFIAILGFFTAFTRPIGIFIFMPLLYEYFRQRNFNIRKCSYSIISLCSIPAGLLVYVGYIYTLTGDIFALVHQEVIRGRTFTNPIHAIILGITNPDFDIIFSAYFSLIFIILLIRFYRKIPLLYLILCGLFIYIPLASGVVSMPRYFLVVFPIYILLAKLTARKEIDDALTICFALLQGALVILWSSGFRLIV